jgi:quercetin dioxygenase-like cupin family protein
MFVKCSADGYRQLMDGVEQKTLVYGDKTLTAEFRLKAGHSLPHHRHPYEQTGYLVSGKITLFIDGRAHECLPGDSWCIGADVEHGAEVAEDAVAVEVFSPVRPDYLPQA